MTPTIGVEGKTTYFPLDKWIEEHHRAANGNSKAMNAIVSDVDEKIYKLIYSCELAKEAWDILVVAHEGTQKVGEHRLCHLTTLFENIMIKEEETISEYSARIYDISNESFSLGEVIDKAKLVSKVLRNLPEKFAMKVLVVKEPRDMKAMKRDELLGSLGTYEMNLKEKKPDKKSKLIALKADVASEDEQDFT